MITLRDYQQRTVDSIRGALNQGMMRPCASVATGGGKTVILAELARGMIERGHRVVVLTHVRELIVQIERTVTEMLGPGVAGVIAAGLNRNDPMRKLQICQIQTVGRRPRVIGPCRVVIVDEAHLIPPEGEGQYRKVLEVLREMTPDIRVIGLTATPFRASTGLIYGENRMFDDCVERVSMPELIKAGYLTRIVGKAAEQNFKADSLHMRGGDFKADELEAFMADEAKVRHAAADFLGRTADRKRVLVFTCGLKHSAMLLDEIRKTEPLAESVDGTMPDGQRDAILKRFREGTTRYLLNCAILTTGYDDPGIDAIVMLRPTRSPGLLLQCAGRGLRLHADKKDCLFLDYGGCLQHFGPLDTIEESITDPAVRKKKEKGSAPSKVCPNCHTVVAAATTKCEDCGYDFPRAIKHEREASDIPVMSGERQTLAVYNIRTRKHSKSDKPPTLRIDYFSKIGLLLASDFLSISPSANLWAVQKSMKLLAEWHKSPFRKVGDTLYGATDTAGLQKLSVDDIVEYAARLTPPASIEVKREGRYYSVVKRTW